MLTLHSARQKGKGRYSLPGVGGGNFVAPRFTPPDGLTFNTSTGNFDGTQTGSGEDLTTSIPDFSGATVVTVSTVGTDTDRGTDLRNKINAAARNTIIIVTSGFTYNVGAGFLELPGKGGTGWIWIVSEKIYNGTFPKLVGQRVETTDSSSMPTITSTDTLGVINSENLDPTSTHYWLAGLNVVAGVTDITQFAINFGRFPSEGQTTASVSPGHFGVDRCLITSNQAISGQGGVGFLCHHGIIRDSRSYGWRRSIIKTDTQGVFCGNGAGPFAIWNNYIEANGENFMMGGGSDPGEEALMPKNIWFKNNYCKKPNEWNPWHSSYVAAANSNCKNHLESKGSWKVLIENNIFENCWSEGQSGHSIQLWCIASASGVGSSQMWLRCSDFTIRNNKFINVNCFANITPAGSEPFDPVYPTQRIEFYNNLGIGLHDPQVFDTGGSWYVFQIGEPNNGKVCTDIAIEHCTALTKDANRTGVVFFSLPGTPTGSPGQHNNITVKNNVGGNTQYLIFSSSGSGTIGLNAHCDVYTFDYNVIIDTFGVAAGMPAGSNAYPATVGVVNFQDATNEDYRLTSTYTNSADDGTDPGCDIDELNTRIAGVL
jgi:hypothetical protein